MHLSVLLSKSKNVICMQWLFRISHSKVPSVLVIFYHVMSNTILMDNLLPFDFHSLCITACNDICLQCFCSEFFLLIWFENSLVYFGCYIKWTLSRNSANSQLKLALSHRVSICINMNHVTLVFISNSSSIIIFWPEILSKEFVKVMKIRRRGWKWQHHCIMQYTKNIISNHHLPSKWEESLNNVQKKCEIKCDFAVHRIEVPH